MNTLTLPDPERNDISTFHTYCIAVGPGSLDHTSVIDSYAKEMEELMEGREYYCGVRNEFIFAKNRNCSNSYRSPGKVLHPQVCPDRNMW